MSPVAATWEADKVGDPVVRRVGNVWVMDYFGYRSSTGTASEQAVPVPQASSSTARMPTEKMISFARSLARARKIGLPEGLETDYQVCRSFLDAHAP